MFIRETFDLIIREMLYMNIDKRSRPHMQCEECLWDFSSISLISFGYRL